MDPGRTHASNVGVGTPFYAAPEVCTSGQATTSSDVYSFGVLAVEVYRCVDGWVGSCTLFCG